MKLFEISDAIEQVLAEGTNHETGEISEEALAALDELEGDLESKALNVARYIVGERAEAKAIKAQADVLSARAKSHENRAKRLTKYLQGHIGDASFKDATVTIGWRKSEAVEIDEGAGLSHRYLNPAPSTPNKALIRAELKSGQTIGGCRLVSRKSIQIK